MSSYITYSSPAPAFVRSITYLNKRRDSLKRFPTPAEVGLPSRFREWRPIQPQVINDGLKCSQRFCIQNQRQGTGKTVSYIAIAVLAAARTMILTANKGLQDQLIRDFAEIGLTDIRGKANYDCIGVPGSNCEDGSVGKCPYRGSMVCTHAAAKQLVTEATICTTNYSCWIAANRYGTGFGKFELLVMDEAHSAPSELDRAMQIRISDNEVSNILKAKWVESGNRDDMGAWKHWAEVHFKIAEHELQRLKNQLSQVSRPSPTLVKNYRHFLHLSRKLAHISMCKPERWIADSNQYGYQFDPTNSSEYGEQVLFNKIPKVLLTSGSVKPKTASQLGIMEDELEYNEYETAYDAGKSPIVYIPTLKVYRHSQPWQLKQWLRTIDEIIESRLDRRIIIHTANFDLRDFIVENSDYKGYMLSNYKKYGDITSQVIEKFKNTPEPCVLVSPSITTGYDFPYDACRVNIIAKLPFANGQSKVEQARNDMDSERGIFQCITNLEQAAFRGDRADDDSQEVFILDDNITWLMSHHRSLFSPYFLAMYRVSKTVPKPRKAA